MVAPPAGSVVARVGDVEIAPAIEPDAPGTVKRRRARRARVTDAVGTTRRYQPAPRDRLADPGSQIDGAVR